MLYDFEGDEDNGELVITEGTMITILNQVIYTEYICNTSYAEISTVNMG